MNIRQAIRFICLGAAVIALFVCPAADSQTAVGCSKGGRGLPALASQDSAKELARIEARFNDEKIQSILNAVGWTLAHAASDAEKRKALAVIGTADGEVGSLQDAIRRAGGVDAYRKQVANLLESKDGIVRGFTAIWLGALGDRRAIPDLLKLLRSTDLPVQETFVEGFDRSRAAMALGMLDAKDVAPELAALLKAKSDDVRIGAALGLGYLKATKHAPEVARLLAQRDSRSSMATLEALGEMDATEQAKDIAAFLKMNRGADPDVIPAAMYVLTKLKAADQASAIAPFLRDAFYKGDAAKALALMNAQQYKHDIASLLDDDNALFRGDALIALGILQAKDYEEKIASHLEDNESFVRCYAAWSLILLESRKYAARSLKLADHAFLSVSGKGAAQIAIREFRQVADRALESHWRLSVLESPK